MKILIDIGHPAHVHYFRNFIKIMENNGHEFLITARDKEVVFNLLDHYNIRYINRGKGGNSLFKKLIYILKADFILLRSALNFKPDIFLSFGSPYAAHVAFITGKHHVAFDDTDHAPLEHAMYVPFTKCIITPNAYLKDFKTKHIRLNSYMELCSTHKDYFVPDKSILNELNLKQGEKYVIIRLVSWNASHDINLKGLSNDGLKKIIELIESKFKILISSEGKLPNNLEKYHFYLEPYKMHQALYFSELVIGESLTMCVEAITLGTPALAITTAKAGVTFEQVNSGLLKKFESEAPLIKELENFLITGKYKENFNAKAKELLSRKTNITKFMVWFIQNYPQSKIKMQIDPNHQDNFI